MAHIALTETVQPGRLQSGERKKLRGELTEIDRKVFEEPATDENLRGFAADPDISLIVLRNDKEEAVGYTTIHPMSVEADGSKHTVLRVHSVVRRPYRGDPEVMGSVLKFVRSWKLRHPFSSAHCVYCVSDPSMYMMLTSYSGAVRPVYRSSADPEDLHVAEAVGNALGLARTGRRDSLVRRSGAALRQTLEERSYWLNSDRRTAQFFLETNPDYAAGNVLLTTLPVTLSNVFSAMQKYEAIAKERAEDRMLAKRGAFREAEAEVSTERLHHTLRTCDLFRYFPEEEIVALAGAVQGKRYHPGEYVVRKGEQGDALYVVAKGSAEVLLEADGEEFAIARLGKREIFGEMAVLTGDPRMASVRAANELSLLRVDRDRFLHLLVKHPEMREPIWNTYARRILENTLRADQRFRDYPEDARKLWVEKTRRIDLPKESSRDLDDAAWMFLVTGHADVENDAERVALWPREVAAIPPGCRLTSGNGAMICLMPTAEEIGIE